MKGYAAMSVKRIAHVHHAPAAALRLGQCLPRLESTEAQLAHRARPVRFSLGHQPADAIRRGAAGGRQGVAIALVARQKLANEPRGRDELRLGIGASDPATEASSPLVGRGLMGDWIRIVAHGGIVAHFGRRRGGRVH